MHRRTALLLFILFALAIIALPLHVTFAQTDQEAAKSDKLTSKEIEKEGEVMNKQGIEGFLGNNITLGGSASVSAGPTGKTLAADTDYKLEAAIYSYSVSNGLFAGISLGGSIIRQDSDTNREYFGQSLTPREIIDTPALGKEIEELTAYLDGLINPAGGENPTIE